MRVYLASPRSQVQAHAANGMNVLVSYAEYAPWMDGYLPSYERVLIDSGAFSELTGTATIDVAAYADWAQRQRGVDAWAGLDDIGGDYKRSLQNYQHGGFPTMHDTDPPELLDDLIDIAKERDGWIGIGLKPPREGKEHFVRSTLERIPRDIHVHGWALRRYAHLPRLDSVDSTNWWRDALKPRTVGDLGHLTYAERLEIVVKRYQRASRKPDTTTEDLPLWTN